MMACSPRRDQCAFLGLPEELARTGGVGLRNRLDFQLGGARREAIGQRPGLGGVEAAGHLTDAADDRLADHRLHHHAAVDTNFDRPADIRGRKLGEGAPGRVFQRERDERLVRPRVVTNLGSRDFERKRCGSCLTAQRIKTDEKCAIKKKAGKTGLFQTIE